MIPRPQGIGKFLVVLLVPLIPICRVAVPALFAQGGGPRQPEFSDFESVSTSELVNAFTGDFTYKIPILNVPNGNEAGYALSLSYHSGVSANEEASWVGSGWTLNPGSIVRHKRGWPDDYSGQQVIYWNDVPKNWTVSVGGHLANPEVFSADIPLTLDGAIRYNRYKGFGYVAGVGLSVQGTLNLNYSVSDGEGSFSASINPAATLNRNLSRALRGENRSEHRAGNHKVENRFSTINRIGQVNLVGSDYGFFSHSEATRPTAVTPYEAASYKLSVSVEGVPAIVPVGGEIGLSGNYNYQRNVPRVSTRGFGYLYSGLADPEAMMDYFLEKDSPYEKRDRFLAIPFSSPDYFVASGEGIMGGFRLYSKRAGHFRPNAQTSTTNFYQLGVEVQAGTNLGIGADVSTGEQSLSVGAWELTDTDREFTFAPPDGEDEAFFFRFSNDLGGSLTFGPSDNAALRANVSGGGPPGGRAFEPRIAPTFETAVANGGQRAGRSSFITYHTNGQMAREVPSPSLGRDVAYSSYTKDPDALRWVDRASMDEEAQGGIGEIVVFSEEGARYVYGLPVYSRNEINLQYGLQGVPASDIDANYLAYRDVPSAQMKVGIEQNAPYATTFLLTEITSPDYVDRSHDGPSRDDFGQYTKFTYVQRYGSPTGPKDAGLNWYRWRQPYTGLFYERNELSDPGDDSGAVIAGEKEVYYLDSIETKTHKAIFLTSPRVDALEAGTNENAARLRDSQGTRQLEKLDAIELYALMEDGSTARHPLLTVNFEYDYSLMRGLPNAASGEGRLTLKRVWVDYEGNKDARISPYEFGYTYETFGYPPQYSALDNYGNFSPGGQNPGFSAFNTDRWGMYQFGGRERHERQRAWVNQAPDPTRFDPGAWNLKSIRLPTGGEIHIQYEQDDYAYVQDKPAMAMVSLKSLADAPARRHYLNVADIGVAEPPGMDPGENPALLELREAVTEQILDPGEKIYFKFLYKLFTPPGVTSSPPQLSDCNAEYVTGYADVQEVGIDEFGLFVILGPPEFPIDPLDLDAPRTPADVCREFVTTQRAGKLVLENRCEASTDGVRDAGSPDEVVLSFLSWLGSLALPAETSLCGLTNPGLSYLRVPLPHAKKGGGIRVKRLLRFDRGIEPGDAVLYGQEYIYETTDPQSGRVISSGVATNEPEEGGEENALVTYLPRAKQSFLSKIIAGRDKKQVEGPIGQSLLPAPSVGYSKVILRDIHAGQSNPGIRVEEYFTARDYPLDAYNDLDGDGEPLRTVDLTGIRQRSDWMIIPAGLFNYNVNNLWLTQGFRFIVNDMHGKPKAESAYTSDYRDLHDPEGRSLTRRREFQYFEPGEMVPILRSPDAIELEPAGKEVEITFETKAVADTTLDLSIELDASIGFASVFPIPFASAFPSITYQESILRTHVATKVVRYPSLVKSIREFRDGAYDRMDNVAFDPASGRSLLSRTRDTFDGLDLERSPDHQGLIHDYRLAASAYYTDVGHKAENEGRILKSEPGLAVHKTRDLFLEFIGDPDAVCDLAAALSPGSLIEVQRFDGTLDGIYHAGERRANRVQILPTAHLPSSDTPEGSVSVEILRSGRTNQLTRAVGRIKTYGPRREIVHHSIPPEIMEPRVEFAEKLNEAASSLGRVQIEIPAGLSFLDPDGNCRPIEQRCRIEAFSDVQTTAVAVVPPQVRRRFRIDCPELCPEITTLEASRFEVDPSTGELLYYTPQANCDPQPFSCVQFCPRAFPWDTLDGVLSAQASRLSDQWSVVGTTLGTSYGLSPTTQENDYETAALGKWRSESEYEYWTGVRSAHGPEGRIYADAGVFDEFTLFNWRHPEANDSDKWTASHHVRTYSPNGEPLVDRDAIGVQHIAKYGYRKTVPYLTAEDAEYESVSFESFETLYEEPSGDAYFEDRLPYREIFGEVENELSHSGRKSFKLALGTTGGGRFARRFRFKPLAITERMQQSGVLVRIWAHSAIPGYDFENKFSLKFIETGAFGTTDRLTVPFTPVARTGAWVQLQASSGELEPELVGMRLDVELTYEDDRDDDVWIDDVLVQPSTSRATAYVYDPISLRMVASFKEPHFATFYEYNGEGRLVRILMETEKGLKLLDERQYHKPLVDRHED